MGFDPGAANFGFGIVRAEGPRMSALDGGVITTPASESMEARLGRIHRGVSELIELHRPDSVAFEEVYFGRNVRSAMSVGQATGVAMLAASQYGIGCHAYTPQAVKMSVCGSGAADKHQVQRMVGNLLRLGGAPSPDHAADALAVAICHAGIAGASAAGRAGVAG